MLVVSDVEAKDSLLLFAGLVVVDTKLTTSPARKPAWLSHDNDK